MKIFGYIDPGLGTLIWQSIVAAVVGFLFYLKKTRQWIVNTFRRIFGRGQKSATSNATVNHENSAIKVEAKTEAR
jgi:hypothetical protein